MGLSRNLTIYLTAVDRTSGALGAATGGFGKLATVAAAGTAVVGGGLAAAATAAIGFEKQMSAVGAVSNASGAQMAQLKKKALQLGADTKYSASEAGKAMEELVKAGVSVPDVLNGAADSVVALAAAGEVALPEAATLAANAMNAFKLSAKDMPGVANIIAGAANASAIDVSEFGMSLAQVGAVAKLAGANFKDTAVAIALMGNAGIKGSDAGTSLKTMLMRLQPTTEKTKGLMEELGIITKDGTNRFYDQQGRLKSLSAVSGVLNKALAGMTQQQKQATLTTLFGSDAIRGAAVLADQGSAGFDKMAASMGKISAADVAKRRMDNAAGAIEQLKGSLETVAISVGSAFLPAIKGVATWLTGAANKVMLFGNGLQGLGGSGVLYTLGATLRGVGSALGVVFGWMGRNKTLVFSLVAAFAALVLITKIHAGVMAVQAAGGLIKYLTQMRIVSAATKAWTAVQWLLNLAMNANPISLIIIGIVALVAIIALAWRNSQTFRNVVLAVWGAIKKALAVAWAVIRPILSVLAKIVGTVLKIAFIVLMNAVKIVWIAIQIIIKAAWAVIKVIFNAIVWVLRHTLGPVFSWLWKNVISPVWNGIKKVISAVWTGGIRPVFNALKSAVKTVGNAFKSAVDFIKRNWDRIVNIAKKPVNFVIGIYNRGIVDLVNKLAGFVGIKTRLGRIPTLARGGTLDNPYAVKPGITNGPMAIVGEGRKRFPEFVIPTDPRYRSRAAKLWELAGSKIMGEPPTSSQMRGKNRLGGEGIAFRRGGSLQHLAFGGIIGDFIKGVKNFTIGNISKGARLLLDKVIGGAVPGGGVIRNVVAAIPGWIKDKVLAWVKAKVATFGGGPAMQRALGWAKTQHGKRYQWGGNGNPSWDCSGFMSAIESVIRGQRPHRRWSTHPFHGGARNPMPGWHRNARSGFMIGVTGAGVGHTAGTLLGKAVESSGSGGVRVGGGARSASNGMFPYRYGFKADNGGFLMPGWNPPIFNGTGKVESILTSQQGEALMRPRGPLVHIENFHPSEAVDVDLFAQRLAFQERAATFG